MRIREREPELVVIRPARHPVVSGTIGECLTHILGGGERIADPCRRSHLLPGQRQTSVGVDKAEPGEIAQRRVDAAVEHPDPVLIGGDDGILFGTDPRPQHPRHERLHALTGDLLAHPPEHIGLARPVFEDPAVLGLRLERGEELIHADARVLPLRLGPADRLLDLPDLGLRVEVVLGEADARTHIEDMAHGRPGVAGLGELGHIVGDQAVRVEVTGTDEDTGDGADERLGHRHEQMLGRRAHLPEVLLGEHGPVVHEHPRIGVGGLDDAANAARFRILRRGNLDLAEVLQIGGQLGHRTGAPGDRRRGKDPCDVLERPTHIVRVLPIVPVDSGRRIDRRRWGHCLVCRGSGRGLLR